MDYTARDVEFIERQQIISPTKEKRKKEEFLKIGTRNKQLMILA